MKKELVYHFLSLLMASLVIATTFSLLSYNKISESIRNTLYPKIITQDYREAFLATQNSNSFNIKSIRFIPHNSKDIVFFSSGSDSFVYRKNIPFFLSKNKDSSLGSLVIEFNLFPEIRTFIYSFLLLLITFGPFHLKFIQMQKTITLQRLKTELGEQILHDIRSPISSLKSLVLSKENRSYELGKVVQQLESITKTFSGSTTLSFGINLKRFIQEIKKEKNQEIKDISLYINCREDLSLFINPLELKRSISNLINNAYEAYPENLAKKEITINVFSEKKYIYIEVVDRGKGIPPSKLRAILKRGNSYDKPQGSGLGLTYAKSVIEKNKGHLWIESKEKAGTKVTLKLLSLSNSDKVVFLEDEAIIRASWRRSAEEKGISLQTYSSSVELLKDISFFSEETMFFIDSDLKEKIKGEVIAKNLHERGFTNLFIVTGYSEEKFRGLHYIKGVLKKDPIFDQ